MSATSLVTSAVIGAGGGFAVVGVGVAAIGYLTDTPLPATSAMEWSAMGILAALVAWICKRLTAALDKNSDATAACATAVEKNTEVTRAAIEKNTEATRQLGLEVRELARNIKP